MVSRALIKGQVLKAFEALGDIARPATFRRFTGQVVRDVDAGVSRPVYETTPLPKVVKATFKETEMPSGPPEYIYQKFLIPALHLTTRPTKDDELVWDDDNIVWTVDKLLGDPADAVWIVQAHTVNRKVT